METVNWSEFIANEKASRDTIDVKRIYIDIAEDLVAGILLSQIVFWHLPDNSGKSKLRVKHEGHLWIAKNRSDWWDECRITERQYDRAVDILEKKGIVVTDTTLFAGKPSKIIRIDSNAFLSFYQDALKRSCTKCNNEIDESVRTITESTTETTTDINTGAETAHTEYKPALKTRTLKEKKPKEPATPKEPPPPAIIVFKEVRRFYPDKALYTLIDNTVGRKDFNLELWRKVLVEWAAIGWNPRNVQGVLDCFKQGGIKKRTNGGNYQKKETAREQFDKLFAEATANGNDGIREEPPTKIIGDVPYSIAQ